jgi:hypothetical protein
MLKSQVKVGGEYRAKVSRKATTVRVDEIIDVKGGTRYHCTNLATGRSVIFRSAARFLGEIAAKGMVRAEAPAVQNIPRDGYFGEEADPLRPEVAQAGQQSVNGPIMADPHLDGPEYNVGPLVEAYLDAAEREEMVQPERTADRLLQKERAAARGLSNKLKARKAGAPHLIVVARAGTGKTTTLTKGLFHMRGLDTGIEPSPQQWAVWEAMAEGRTEANRVGMVAFNKAIAEDFRGKVPPGVDTMTMHSLGYRAVNAAVGYCRVDKDRSKKILCELMGYSDPRQVRGEALTVLNAADELVRLCKMNLVDADQGEDQAPGSWDAALDQLTSHYDVELNGCKRQVYLLVPQALDRCADTTDRTLNFDDMVWLPVRLRLPVPQYDLLLVDESQDLNRCQQELACMAGRRLVLCGDDRQAIYGFAGADARSISNMQERLGATDRGAVVLPLTVTRRCGRAIVEEARKIVGDFEAHESNPDGVVRTGVYEAEGKTYRDEAVDGDFVLCRVNAPLVSQCFKFLKQGRKANIQGRDIGQGLVRTIRGLKAGTVAQLVGKVSDWLEAETRKEQAKRFPNENKLIVLQDRADCILVFTEGAATVEEVVGRIEKIFTDDRQAPGIRLSSIHKAKGLEARRVYLLKPKGAGIPHPMARTEWQQGQEMNLLYVAVTRAIEELVFVS